jgi:hypothetical protein
VKKILAISILISALFVFSVSGQTQASVTSGNWYLQTTSQVAVDASQMPQIGGSLTQTGSTVSGVLHVSNSTCFVWATDVPVSGTVTGNSVTLTSASVAGQIITITGSATSTLITGTYSIASGCAGGDYGTITATLVPPTTANWTGTVANVATNNAATVSLSQGSPNADGYSPLSGSISLSGLSCPVSGTLDADQSWILGNLVQAVATLSDGSVLALNGFITDATTLADQMTLNFSISGGPCAGQGGSVTYTRP